MLFYIKFNFHLNKHTNYNFHRDLSLLPVYVNIYTFYNHHYILRIKFFNDAIQNVNEDS